MQTPTDAILDHLARVEAGVAGQTIEIRELTRRIDQQNGRVNRMEAWKQAQEVAQARSAGARATWWQVWGIASAAVMAIIGGAAGIIEIVRVVWR